MRLNSCSEDEAEKMIQLINEEREQEAKLQKTMNPQQGSPSQGNNSSNNSIKPKGGNK